MTFNDEILEDDGPDIAEYGFDIEDDEEHGHEVELDGEAGGSITDGEHTAFVSFIFDAFRFSSLAEVEAHHESDTSESYREENLKKDREKIGKHVVVRLK